MIPLLNAIYTKFTTDSALTTAFPGGLHRDQAPEGTTLPYLVSHVASSQTELAYGDASRSLVQIRFSAFGVGHDATGSLAQALIANLDGALLTLSQGNNDGVVRKGDAIPVLHSHDSLGNDVWEWWVIYEYGVMDS